MPSFSGSSHDPALSSSFASLLEVSSKRRLFVRESGTGLMHRCTIVFGLVTFVLQVRGVDTCGGKVWLTLLVRALGFSVSSKRLRLERLSRTARFFRSLVSP